MRWFCGAAVLCAMAAGPAQAQITDMRAAINKAGRQRMLSQRIAKLYLEIGQDVDTDRSRRAFDTSIAQFDRQLVELKNFVPQGAVRQTYLMLEKSWLAYKEALLAAPPSPQGGMRQEYADALRELESTSGNSPAIRDQLALGRTQWNFFEIALKSRSDDKRTQATNVATISERLLEVMDTLTELYEKQAK